MKQVQILALAMSMTAVSCGVKQSKLVYPETAKELLQKDIPDWLIDGYRTDTCLFQNKDNRVQIQTYHLPLGIGLR